MRTHDVMFIYTASFAAGTTLGNMRTHDVMFIYATVPFLSDFELALLAGEVRSVFLHIGSQR